MGSIRLPAYTRRKRLADGKWAYFWELPGWARPPGQAERAWSVANLREGCWANAAFDVLLAITRVAAGLWTHKLPVWDARCGGVKH